VLKVLKAQEGMAAKIEDRLETLLPEEPRDGYEVFKEGKIIPVPGSSPQRRRFALVRSVDVIVSVGGCTGTEQMLDLALALRCPTLPIPLFGGASKRCWERDREHIKQRFALPAVPWEQLDPHDANAMQKAAELVAETLYAPVGRRAWF
jgi:hypothetical protein